MTPICTNVLDSRFAELNAAAGYDPAYDYLGPDVLNRGLGWSLKRQWCGADLNPAAWLHDIGVEAACEIREWDKAERAWDAANREFRENVRKLIAAAGHPLAARVVAWGMWLGVSCIPWAVNRYVARTK